MSYNPEVIAIPAFIDNDVQAYIEKLINDFLDKYQDKYNIIKIKTKINVMLFGDEEECGDCGESHIKKHESIGIEICFNDDKILFNGEHDGVSFLIAFERTYYEPHFDAERMMLYHLYEVEGILSNNNFQYGKRNYLEIALHLVRYISFTRARGLEAQEEKKAQ